MLPGKPSFMAEAVAWFRAAHQLLDDEPLVFPDPLAVKILGPDTVNAIRERMDSLGQPYLKKARALVLVRARFTEDECALSAARGVSQYIILGAGLDTSPYRAPAAIRKMRIFEVDHPDTQAWKREKLRAAGIQPPDNLRYAPIDFNRQSLPDVLAGKGFDPLSPAFFSWLGVSCYLERPAVYAMLEYVAGLARGSQIVFDFLVDNAQLSADNRRQLSKAADVGRRAGEPWITGFVPSALEADLRQIGFSDVQHVSDRAANALYLPGRTDGLELDPAMQIMSAAV